MNRLNWFISRRLERLPLLTLMAWLSLIALLIASVWLVILARTPMPESEDSLEKVQNTVTVVTANPSSELLSGAPKLVQVTHAVETLYRVARQHQLTLEEVIYQDQQSQSKALVEYLIDFQVQQSYPRVKAFVTELLAALPYLALEQISFERNEIENAQIQSRMQFKLFLERDDG